MARLHLTANDLARVRIALAWPFTEVRLSIMQLQQPRPNYLLTGWRQLLGAQNEQWALLSLVFPPSPTIDLHTVVGSAPTMDQALELVQAAPARHLRQDLRPLHPYISQAMPWARRWLQALVEGDPHARHELVELLRAYHARAIAPYWHGIRSHLGTEWARCGRIMGEGGVGRLLCALHPGIRWQAPVLTVAGSDPDSVSGVDYSLEGRSIVILPTVFGLTPHVLHNLVDATAPFVLTYPALREADAASAIWNPRTEPNRAGLALALGSTRARALETVADACTTSELAHRLGVSPSTASDHAYKLRMARLITTERTGTAVLHSLTDLGRALLEGHDPK